MAVNTICNEQQNQEKPNPVNYSSELLLKESHSLITIICTWCPLHVKICNSVYSVKNLKAIMVVCISSGREEEWYLDIFLLNNKKIIRLDVNQITAIK